MHKIVFLDIDGTILGTNHKIPDSTKEAIKLLQKKNIDVVIATGRPPFITDFIAKELNIDSYICFNGGYINYKGSVLSKKSIRKNTLAKLDTLAKKNGHLLTFQSEFENVLSVEHHPDTEMTYSHLVEGLPIHKKDFIEKEIIYATHLHCKSGEEKEYEEEIPELNFIRWSKPNTGMDVGNKNITKREGIRELLDYLKILPEEAIAIGDGLNDIEMISFVGLGIAMGNSHDELKKAADYVTRHVDDNGIFHALSRFKII